MAASWIRSVRLQPDRARLQSREDFICFAEDARQSLRRPTSKNLAFEWSRHGQGVRAIMPPGRAAHLNIVGLKQPIYALNATLMVMLVRGSDAMNRRLFTAALAVLTMVGCGVVLPSGNAVRDRAGVEASTAAFHQALRTNDLEAFMSYVAEDVFFMPPGEPPVRGRNAVREWMTDFLRKYRTSSLTLAEREVLVGDGWAVELGTFEWELRPAAGGPAVVDRGNYMQVWKEQGAGKWRFAREVYNSSVAPVPVAAK